jgi:predicted AAA+ superfamily ATPase
MKYVIRHIESSLKEYTNLFPVTAILGPRQCGKSTLIREFIKNRPNMLYMDLESQSEREKLKNPEQFFSHNQDKQFCLDEIQRVPQIFESLRSIIDKDREAGRFIILGSASRDLIRQSSESLAGRIGYLELTPFLFPEIQEIKYQTDFWLQGGFPDSLLNNTRPSILWRNSFIRTFLERDIPQMGFPIPQEIIGRLWRMLAHQHGQVLNLSSLGKSLGVSHTSIRRYIDLLNQTFMTRELKPYDSNLKKRLVKSPKIYIRDSGILHSLLNIESLNSLMSHPVFGFSWEGLVIENVCSLNPEFEASFYKSSQGSEIDLVLQKGDQQIAIECKVGDAPKPTKGFWLALKDIQPEISYIVAPQVKNKYPIAKNVWVIGLEELSLEL